MEHAAPSFSYTPPVRSAPVRFADRYVGFLGVVLVGYAVAGRGFAYLGVPPLFIGEIALALGLAALVSLHRAPSLVRPFPMGLVVLLVGWAVVRVALGVPEWGIDAARDGMLVVYALFGVIAFGLVLHDPERLRLWVRQFGTVVSWLVLVAVPLHFFGRIFPNYVPVWPWAPVAIVQTKPGDLLVLLALASVYVAGTFSRPRPLVLVGLVAGSIALMVTSRGGMLGFVLAMGLAALWKPRSARFGKFVYVGAALVLVGVAVGSTGVTVNDGDRDFSVGQLWENVKSMVGQSEQSQLQGTAEWRMEWWKGIVGYTFGGEYFLDGKGFGINLATDDGYQVDDEGSLRSPHNSHLNVLARGGVPMFSVWLLVQGLWFLSIGRAAGRARRAGLDAWATFFAGCGAFWVAAFINGSFDVYLEGPMGAVWFWVVFGVGLAGTRLSQTHPNLLDDMSETAPSNSTSGPAWAPAAPPTVRAPAPATADPAWSWSPSGTV